MLQNLNSGLMVVQLGVLHFFMFPQPPVDAWLLADTSVSLSSKVSNLSLSLVKVVFSRIIGAVTVPSKPSSTTITPTTPHSVIASTSQLCSGLVLDGSLLHRVVTCSASPALI